MNEVTKRTKKGSKSYIVGLLDYELNIASTENILVRRFEVKKRKMMMLVYHTLCNTTEKCKRDPTF